VRLPLLASDTRFGFVEFSRRAGDFAMTAALVTWRFENGAMCDVRVGIGGAEPSPRRVVEAEGVLNGQVPGDAPFRAAAEAAANSLTTEPARVAALRDRLESELRSTTPDLVIFAAGIGRLPNTSLVAVPGTKAETALIAFDLKGIALSSGSACSSGKVQPSHVLAAMGVEPALARAALRISLGWETIETDLDLCLNAWKQVVSSLGKERGGRAA